MMLCLAPLTATHAAAEQTYRGGDIPGMPDNALKYNRTDTSPKGQVENITAREMHVFYYENVTLALNSSRNFELNLTIDSKVGKRILCLSVDPNQTMALQMNITGSPPLGEMVMERTLNFYLGLEPNATLQLSAQIRLHINETQLNQELNRVVNASRLTWMYWNRTRLEWVPVDSYMDQNGYLVCNTNHFSTWTVAEITPTQSAYVWYLTTSFIIIMIAVLVTIILVVLIRIT